MWMVSLPYKRRKSRHCYIARNDVNTKRDGYINEAAEVAAKAGYKSYRFAKTIDLEGGEYGIVILSKYPLSNTITHNCLGDNLIKLLNRPNRFLLSSTFAGAGCGMAQ